MKLPPLPRIDFKKYRQRRYLFAVCEEYGGVALWSGMAYVRSRCPLCYDGGDGGKRVGWWNFTTGYYHCHKCKATKDAMGLVMLLEKCSAVAACRSLEKKAGAAGSGLVA